ncbi:hypothetical protein H6G36_25690 [Anabaena minutissima FACHB-250]|nr:hypothetical protein [Anabaena minutissima FACHB-250]
MTEIQDALEEYQQSLTNLIIKTSQLSQRPDLPPEVPLATLFYITYLLNGGGSSPSGGATEISLQEVLDRLPSALVGDRFKVDVANLEISNDEGNPIPTQDAGTEITGVAIPSGGAGVRGWLSAIWKLISDRFMPPGTIAAYLGTSSGANLKDSAGNIYAITVSNSSSSTRYFQIFNQTTSPSLNDVPVRSFPVPPDDSLLLLGQDIIGGNGIVLTTGISWGFSTTRLTYTAATATDCIATVRWA